MNKLLWNLWLLSVIPMTPISMYVLYGDHDNFRSWVYNIGFYQGLWIASFVYILTRPVSASEGE